MDIKDACVIIVVFFSSLEFCLLEFIDYGKEVCCVMINRVLKGSTMGIVKNSLIHIPEK